MLFGVTVFSLINVNICSNNAEGEEGDDAAYVHHQKTQWFLLIGIHAVVMISNSKIEQGFLNSLTCTSSLWKRWLKILVPPSGLGSLQQWWISHWSSASGVVKLTAHINATLGVHLTSITLLKRVVMVKQNYRFHGVCFSLVGISGKLCLYIWWRLIILTFWHLASICSPNSTEFSFWRVTSFLMPQSNRAGNQVPCLPLAKRGLWIKHSQ